jgi:hypothetical protein
MNKHEEAKKELRFIDVVSTNIFFDDYIEQFKQTEKELAELKKIISLLAYYEKSDSDTHIDRFQHNLIKLVEKGNEYRKVLKEVE